VESVASRRSDGCVLAARCVRSAGVPDQDDSADPHVAVHGAALQAQVGMTFLAGWRKLAAYPADDGSKVEVWVIRSPRLSLTGVFAGANNGLCGLAGLAVNDQV